MKRTDNTLEEMIGFVPEYIKKETDLEFGVSDRLADLMKEKGVSKVALAHDLGKRPSEITKWLSGQHNFTLRTIALLSAYFRKPIVDVLN